MFPIVSSIFRFSFTTDLSCVLEFPVTLQQTLGDSLLYQGFHVYVVYATPMPSPVPPPISHPRTSTCATLTHSLHLSKIHQE